MAPSDSDARIEGARVDSADIKSDVRIALFRLDQLDKKFDLVYAEIKNGYATKSELEGLAKKVDGMSNNISWLVKTILGVVVVAILGLVIMKGGGVTH